MEPIGYSLLFVDHNLENVVFLGDAPEMFIETFQWADVDICYPAGNTTYANAVEMNADCEGVRWIEACTDHQFVRKTRQATCTLTGYTGRECSVCGLLEVTGELISATGHDLVFEHEQAPSCDSSGWITHYCNICQEYVSESFGRPQGHSYDENGEGTTCLRNAENAGIVENVAIRIHQYQLKNKGLW